MQRYFGLLYLLRALSAQAHSLLHKEMNLLWNLEMTEMAAAHTHRYKHVCMYLQLYTYLVMFGLKHILNFGSIEQIVVFTNNVFDCIKT